MTRASIATNEPQTPMPKKWPYKPDERRVLDITRTGETRTDRRRAPPRADAARRSARCRSGRAPGRKVHLVGDLLRLLVEAEIPVGLDGDAAAVDRVRARLYIGQRG